MALPATLSATRLRSAATRWWSRCNQRRGRRQQPPGDSLPLCDRGRGNGDHTIRNRNVRGGDADRDRRVVRATCHGDGDAAADAQCDGGAVATYTGGSGEYASSPSPTPWGGAIHSRPRLPLNGVAGAQRRGDHRTSRPGLPATLTLPAPGSVDELAMANIVIATTPAPILLGKTVSPGPAMASYVQTISWDIVPGATSYVLEMRLVDRHAGKSLHDPQQLDENLHAPGRPGDGLHGFAHRWGFLRVLHGARTSAPARARRRR